MPRSIFLGRPWPAPGEPLWTPDDRAWALALGQLERDTCPDCRQPWSETSHPGNEFAYRAELHRCHACAAGARAVANYQETGGRPAGLHVQVIKEEMARG